MFLFSCTCAYFSLCNTRSLEAWFEGSCIAVVCYTVHLFCYTVLLFPHILGVPRAPGTRRHDHDHRPARACVRAGQLMMRTHALKRTHTHCTRTLNNYLIQEGFLLITLFDVASTSTFCYPNLLLYCYCYTLPTPLYTIHQLTPYM